MIRYPRALARLCVLSATLVAAACGGVREAKLPESGVTLEGTVSYGGEQLQFAMIFAQSGDNTSTGKIGDDGRYRIENAPLGEVKLAVNTDAARGDFQSKSMSAGAYQGPEAKGKGKVVGVKFVDVPKKYAEPNTSGLSTTTKAGSNTYDITISK